MHGLAICAGIGGLELGLRLALGDEYRTVCYVEREACSAATLVARMADKTLDTAPVWDDVTTFDGNPWCGVVDILTAGFPCQPWSVAGRKAGVDDERWIWPDIARIIREVGPGLVLLENVPGLIAGGGLGHVLRDLAEAGFDAEWDVFSAAECGATHKRERVFILAYRRHQHKQLLEREAGPEPAGVGEGMAYRSGGGRGELRQPSGGEGQFDGRDEAMADPRDRQFQEPGRGSERRAGVGSAGAILADTDEQHGDRGGLGASQVCGVGCAQAEILRSGELGDSESTRLPERCGRVGGNELPPFPPGPSDIDAWSRVLAIAPSLEPAVCGVVDGSTSRVDRLRACGNGVVPIVAAYAYRSLARAILKGGST